MIWSGKVRSLSPTGLRGRWLKIFQIFAFISFCSWTDLTTHRFPYFLNPHHTIPAISLPNSISHFKYTKMIVLTIWLISGFPYSCLISAVVLLLHSFPCTLASTKRKSQYFALSDVQFFSVFFIHNPVFTSVLTVRVSWILIDYQSLPPLYPLFVIPFSISLALSPQQITGPPSFQIFWLFRSSILCLVLVIIILIIYVNCLQSPSIAFALHWFTVRIFLIFLQKSINVCMSSAVDLDIGTVSWA